VLKLGPVYEEVQDIKSPISGIAPSTKDSNVFIYYGAAPAVIFHYPDRRFFISKSARGDINAMYREALSLEGCRIYLVFSHVFRREDGELLEILKSNGHSIEIDEKFVGSRLVRLSRCGG
jgi:diphthamide synthase subunit DPH2